MAVAEPFHSDTRYVAFVFYDAWRLTERAHVAESPSAPESCSASPPRCDDSRRLQKVPASAFLPDGPAGMSVAPDRAERAREMLESLAASFVAVLGLDREPGELGAVWMALRTITVYLFTLLIVRLGSKR